MAHFQYFFIYDHSTLQSETDDLMDSIIFFYPAHTTTDVKCVLCGQMMGVLNFFKRSFNGAVPKIFLLENRVKFACYNRGNVTFCGGVHADFPDSSLLKLVSGVSDCIEFFEGCLVCQDWSRQWRGGSESVSRELEQTVMRYIAHVSRYGDFVSSCLGTVPRIQLSDSSMFFRLSNWGNRLALSHSAVIGSAVSYGDKLLHTQLPASLNTRLLLMKPRYVSNVRSSNFPWNMVYRDPDNSFIVINAYLDKSQYQLTSPYRPVPIRRHVMSDQYPGDWDTLPPPDSPFANVPTAPIHTLQSTCQCRGKYTKLCILLATYSNLLLMVLLHNFDEAVSDSLRKCNISEMLKEIDLRVAQLPSNKEASRHPLYMQLYEHDYVSGTSVAEMSSYYARNRRYLWRASSKAPSTRFENEYEESIVNIHSEIMSDVSIYDADDVTNTSGGAVHTSATESVRLGSTYQQCCAEKKGNVVSYFMHREYY